MLFMSPLEVFLFLNDSDGGAITPSEKYIEIEKKTYSGWSLVSKGQWSGRCANIYVVDSPERTMGCENVGVCASGPEGRYGAEETGAPRKWEDMSTGVFRIGWCKYKRRCFNWKPRPGTQTKRVLFH